jgi:hypothetical protein
MAISSTRLSNVVRESRDDVKNADRDWILINPILTKRERGKANGGLHPPEPPCIGLSEEVENCGSACFIRCGICRKVCRVYLSLLFIKFSILRDPNDW